MGKSYDLLPSRVTDYASSNSFTRFAYGVLRRFLPEEKVESIKGLALTADGKGAVFDVSAEDLDMFLSGTSLDFQHVYYFDHILLAYFGLLSFTKKEIPKVVSREVLGQAIDTTYLQLSAGQKNAHGVSLEVVEALPQLQEREQSKGGRFGGRGGYGGGRFSGGRGGGNRFSGGGNSGRGRSNYKKW